jgi:hypothetical protein
MLQRLKAQSTDPAHPGTKIGVIGCWLRHRHRSKRGVGSINTILARPTALRQLVLFARARDSEEGTAPGQAGCVSSRGHARRTGQYLSDNELANYPQAPSRWL